MDESLSDQRMNQLTKKQKTHFQKQLVALMFEEDITVRNLSKKLGVRHFSLSFADSKESVLKFKKIIGKNSIIISKRYC